MKHGTYQDTKKAGKCRYLVTCEHGEQTYARNQNQANHLAHSTQEFCEKCAIRYKLLMSLGGKGRSKLLTANDTLSRLTSEIWNFGKRSAEVWEDIDAYGVMPELYGDVARSEEKEIREILAKYGYTAKRFIDELTERTSDRWVYHNFFSVLNLCIDDHPDQDAFGFESYIPDLSDEYFS